MGWLHDLFFGSKIKKEVSVNNRMLFLANDIKNKSLKDSVVDALKYIKLLREAKNNLPFGKSLYNNMDKIMKNSDYKSIYEKYTKRYFPNVVCVEEALNEILKYSNLPRGLYNYLREAKAEFHVDISLMKRYGMKEKLGIKAA